MYAMGPWIEIYASEEVQWDLRQQATGHAAAIAASVAITVFIGSMVGLHALPYELLFLSIGAGSLCSALFATSRLVGLQSRVWCLKMSPHMIMGYNHARKSTVLAWSQVEHVDVNSDSVAIVVDGHSVIEIPSAFDDFVHVSHRILDLAELHRRPVHVRGRSLAEMDVFSLLPDLHTILSDPLVPGLNAA